MNQLEENKGIKLTPADRSDAPDLFRLTKLGLADFRLSNVKSADYLLSEAVSPDNSWATVLEKLSGFQKTASVIIPSMMEISFRGLKVTFKDEEKIKAVRQYAPEQQSLLKSLDLISLPDPLLQVLTDREVSQTLYLFGKSIEKEEESGSPKYKKISALIQNRKRMLLLHQLVVRIKMDNSENFYPDILARAQTDMSLLEKIGIPLFHSDFQTRETLENGRDLLKQLETTSRTLRDIFAGHQGFSHLIPAEFTQIWDFRQLQHEIYDFLKGSELIDGPRIAMEKLIEFLGRLPDGYTAGAIINSAYPKRS
ncbi:MAG: hypothetical protein UV73_C0008G0042 [Candidatus Gottesmanbacteria bacterium GW2011_GWA2_43_14]|uniref:Uncharacterized protein n=1 Tax=Candidatus Gottesmanbacteria bacterium GW2011_GWA2_43_14 TaxID=1618443 RepID=A0A0G1DIU9_9BACT|nr:MAG: hypothetical protein UV73_C0008G0042 [Candidatus Gottesmanbacteria bacterium GW2011_GWA2_43_14]